MAQPLIQHSFHAGEWAPALNARTDLAKYHSAAALLKNFYVDYRGGASTRAGTKYVLQTYKNSTVRLISFNASFTTNYVLEFGDFYIRFHFNGAPILETSKAILGITQASPGSINVTAHGFNTGDWVFLTGIVGMTQLNGRYAKVVNIDANHFSLQRLLDGSAINTGAYGAYTSGGTVARVYTLPSPFAAADLALIKFTQDINIMILCHPNYNPQLLTLVSANNWTITNITFGATIPAPTGQAAATTLAAGTVNYSYEVTAVDFNGQESAPSGAATLASIQDITTVAGSNTVTWTAVSGAQFYNVYKATRRYGAAVPSGAAHGFIGFTFGTAFVDTNIASDFSITPPVPQNPFIGGPVTSYTVTNPGTYTTDPTVTVAAPSSGQTATAQAVLQVQGTPTVSSSGDFWGVGQLAYYTGAGGPITLVVATVGGGGFGGHVLTFQPITYPGSVPGNVSSGAVPANPVTFNSVPGGGGFTVAANLTWGVGYLLPISGGTGYLSAPAVTFSAGAATATATISVGAGLPSVPAFLQQRLVLAGPNKSPQQMNFSRPASYFNYDKSNPVQGDDAIQATLNSLKLNSIKSMIPMSQGLVVLTDQQAWLVNGGGVGAPLEPQDATATAQAYNGASDLPPIVANFDLLYGQSKGSIIRDLTFNFYTQIYTGTDISVLSSHLFYGFTIVEWSYAEEPFKVIWAVRNDGKCLSLTFLKEQDLVGWGQHDTTGLFKSTCAVTESVSFGKVDAVYFVIQRTINGNTNQYIERMAERFFSGTVNNAWCVDAGLQYSGSPATSFSGAEHLANTQLTGLADGKVVTVTPDIDGFFTLGVAASKVTVGLTYTPQLQSVALDVGQPTVQGKRKKILGTTARLSETLGLSVGRTFSTLTSMKDTVVGNVPSISSGAVGPITDLVTSDARTIPDPLWDTFGQICFQQSNPFPATILGIMPEFEGGDDVK
jgi:Ubiquitin-activating enzyme E1 FCCH domain